MTLGTVCLPSDAKRGEPLFSQLRPFSNRLFLPSITVPQPPSSSPQTTPKTVTATSTTSPAMGKRATGTSAFLGALFTHFLVLQTFLPVLFFLSYPGLTATPVHVHTTVYTWPPYSEIPGTCSASRLVHLPRGSTFCALPATQPVLTIPVAYSNGTIGYTIIDSPIYRLPLPRDHLLLVPQTSRRHQGRDRTSRGQMYPQNHIPQSRSPPRTVVRTGPSWYWCMMASVSRWVYTSVASVCASVKENRVLWVSWFAFTIGSLYVVSYIVSNLLEDYEIDVRDTVFCALIKVVAVVRAGDFLQRDAPR